MVTTSNTVLVNMGEFDDEALEAEVESDVQAAKRRFLW